MLRDTLWRLRWVFALFLAAQAFGAQASTFDIAGAMNIGPSCYVPGDSVCGTPPGVSHGRFPVEASMGWFAPYKTTFGLTTNLNLTSEPVGVPFSLPNLIAFELNTNNAITLTSMDQGSGAEP